MSDCPILGCWCKRLKPVENSEFKPQDPSLAQQLYEAGPEFQCMCHKAYKRLGLRDPLCPKHGD